MLELPVHKFIRLNRINYLGQNYYFVTLCCSRRRSVFVDARFSEWILTLLRSESAANRFNVHAYCLMPDHLHFLAEGTEPGSDLRHFVKSLKIKSSRRYSEQFGVFLWQKRYYEHILRASESAEAVACYIWLNPVRKRLAAKPEEYPFVGSFTGKVMPSGREALNWCPPWKKMPCPNS